MLQIANETLQAQCKVSAVRVKPSATTSRAGYDVQRHDDGV